MDPRFSLAGLVVGILVGLSGVGGSAILAPVLILLLGIKPSVAIGTDLLYSVPTKLLAFALHARQKTIDWRIVRPLLAGGVPGALAGLTTFAALRARVEVAQLELALRHAIGIAILIACAGAVATWLARRRDGARRAPIAAGAAAGLEIPSVAVAVAGFVVGVLVALTSIGSGSVTLPLLVLALPAIALRRLIGSEIAFAACLVPLAAAGHLGFGDANLGMAGLLLIGSLPGVWIGSRLANVVDESWLRPIVVGTLVFAGSRLV